MNEQTHICSSEGNGNADMPTGQPGSGILDVP